MKNVGVLESLKRQREENILKIIQWSEAEFLEMEETYKTAKLVAESVDDAESAKIIEEKISQLNAAKDFKKSSGVQL